MTNNHYFFFLKKAQAFQARTAVALQTILFHLAAATGNLRLFFFLSDHFFPNTLTLL